MSLQIISSSRATIINEITLAAEIPATARAGDLVMVVVMHGQASACVAPTGWALLDQLGSGADVASVYVRQLELDAEPSAMFALGGAPNEWQGELVVVRGASAPVVREQAATTTFAGSSALATAGATSQQAINVLLSIWTCAGALTLSLPAGFAMVDGFSSANVSPRSVLIGYQLAGATGDLALPPASASANATGRSFTFTLRDRSPVEPPGLVDLTPGNVGLFGRDTRPAR